MSLFRSEVLAERTAPRWGRVIVSRSPVLGWASLGLVLLALAGLAAVLSLEYARKVRISDYLEPHGGIAEVTAPAAGRVAALHVRDEDQVQAGQVLALLNHDRYSEHGGRVYVQEVDYLKASQQRLRRRTLADAEKLDSEARSVRRQLNHLGEEQAALLDEQRLAQEQRALMRTAEVRVAKLAAQGLVASSAYERERQGTLAAAQAASRTRRALAAVERQIVQAQAALVRLDQEREAQRLAADQELADLSRQLVRLAEQRQTAIVAPKDGIVTFVQFAVGDRVAAEQVLMTVTQVSGATNLVLLASADAATDMAVGDAVRFKALSGQRRRNPIGTAVVRELSQTPQKPYKLQSWIVVNGPVFRARAQVSKFPEGFPIRDGMRVDAFVVTKSRTLWRWLVSPLLAALEGL